MSGIAGLIRSALGAAPDELSIEIGASGNRYRPWQSISVTRSCELIPNAFTLTASTEFLQGLAFTDTTPGKLCNVYLGDDLVITGRIDRRTIAADAHSHQITLSGRGLTRNLVDCSADLYTDPSLRGGWVNAINTLDLAQRLCKSFGLTARSAVSDLGLPIPGFQVGLDETPYQIIESVARYAGYLVYEDEKGVLVLDRIGTQSMASGFTMPGNIEAITGERSVDGRFSDYIVVWNPVATLTQIAGEKSNFRAVMTDRQIKAIEYRPKIIVSGQQIAAYEVGQAMANWELARRYGRSQAALITTDSWRDMAGKLWQPNWLATIDAPGADISGAKWIIGTVTYRKDASGTHADLVMMPQAAFSVQPNPLHLFDAQLSAVPPTAQNPEPPSTSHGLGWNGRD